MGAIKLILQYQLKNHGKYEWVNYTNANVSGTIGITKNKTKKPKKNPSTTRNHALIPMEML